MMLFANVAGELYRRMGSNDVQVRPQIWSRMLSSPSPRLSKSVLVFLFATARTARNGLGELRVLRGFASVQLPRVCWGLGLDLVLSKPNNCSLVCATPSQVSLAIRGATRGELVQASQRPTRIPVLHVVKLLSVGLALPIKCSG